MIYLKVSIPILLYKTFIYSSNHNPDTLFLGQGVKVKFNNRITSGYIISTSDKTSYKGKINPIIDINENSANISQELLDTINWMSTYYICPIGKTLKSTIPFQLFHPIKKEYIKKIKISKEGKKNINQIIYPKQKNILKFLDAQQKYIDINTLADIAVSYKDICKKLETKKLVDIKLTENSYKESVVTSSAKTILNKEQSIIFKDITYNIKKGQKHFILSGVPGSGKTEVYIKIIKSILNLNQTIIVLVPEISLIQQTFDKLSQNFGNIVGQWHSKISKNNKNIVLQKIKHQEIKIMVGTRSCLFMPLNKLGLIIVDEEQETSFKQTNATPYYNARDVAIIRSKFSKCALLLCSATMSVETYYNNIKGNFKCYFLKHRYNNYNMPKITTIDMIAESYNKKFTPVISDFLKRKIDEALEKKEQIVLLQNRRSYSFIIKCLECNDVIQCPNCCVSLKYHKDINKVKCHHCDYTKKFTSLCNVCNKNKITLFGVGTQRLENITKKIFPNSKVIRYDRDVTSKKENYSDLLNAFNKQEANILIGTQMIAKGLDFKNVSVVGVINADVGLLLPDFRSGEKIFNLLYQFSGRAGRHKQNSNAIIQTYNIDDKYIQYACSNNLKNYYKDILKERKELFYPPYSRLIKINIKGRSRKIIYKKIEELALSFKTLNSISILGPTICPIEKINNFYRMHMIIKSPKNNWIDFYNFIVKKIGLNNLEKSNQKYDIKIDVDPMMFL